MQEVKFHPASVDLELIKRLIAITKCTTLRQFLFKDFSSISKDYAGKPSNLPDKILQLTTTPAESPYIMHKTCTQ